MTGRFVPPADTPRCTYQPPDDPFADRPDDPFEGTLRDRRTREAFLLGLISAAVMQQGDMLITDVDAEQCWLDVSTPLLGDQQMRIIIRHAT